jgi:hypothetical protein
MCRRNTDERKRSRGKKQMSPEGVLRFISNVIFLKKVKKKENTLGKEESILFKIM